MSHIFTVSNISLKNECKIRSKVFGSVCVNRKMMFIQNTAHIILDFRVSLKDSSNFVGLSICFLKATTIIATKTAIPSDDDVTRKF